MAPWTRWRKSTDPPEPHLPHEDRSTQVVGIAVTSDMLDGGLTIIDTATRKVARKVKVSGDKQAGQVTIMFSNDGKRLFAAETGKAQIAEVDLATGRRLRTLAAGQGADGLGYSAR